MARTSNSVAKKDAAAKDIQTAKQIQKRQPKQVLRMKTRVSTRSQSAKKALMAKLIEEILQKPGYQELKGTATNDIFTVEQIRTLLTGGQMLNDVHVNLLLKDICKGKATVIDSLDLFNSRRWTKVVAQIQNAELAVLPIFGAKHWSVMLLNIKTKLAVYCDSITNANGEGFHERAAKYLVTKIGEHLGGCIEYFKMPVFQQRDVTSCGLHVIRNAEILLMGENYWDSQLLNDIDTFRQRYAERLLFGSPEEKTEPMITYISAEPVEGNEEEADDDIEIEFEVIQVVNKDDAGVVKEKKNPHQDAIEVITIDDDESESETHEQSQVVPNFDISVIVIDD